MITRDDLMIKIMEFDKPGLSAEINDEISIDDVRSFSEKHLKQEIKSILGLDIYKYSEYDDDRQPLVPIVFDSLFKQTVSEVSRVSLLYSRIMKMFSIEGVFDSHLFNSDLMNIRDIHIQKIEDTVTKSTQLNIYNVEIQMHIIIEIDEEMITYVCTLGNTNITNI